MIGWPSGWLCCLKAFEVSPIQFHLSTGLLTACALLSPGCSFWAWLLFACIAARAARLARPAYSNFPADEGPGFERLRQAPAAAFWSPPTLPNCFPARYTRKRWLWTSLSSPEPSPLPCPTARLGTTHLLITSFPPAPHLTQHWQCQCG